MSGAVVYLAHMLAVFACLAAWIAGFTYLMIAAADATERGEADATRAGQTPNDAADRAAEGG